MTSGKGSLHGSKQIPFSSVIDRLPNLFRIAPRCIHINCHRSADVLVVLGHVQELVQVLQMLCIIVLTVTQFVLQPVKTAAKSHVLVAAKLDVTLHVKEHVMQYVRTHALQVAKLIAKVDVKGVVRQAVQVTVRMDVKEHARTVVVVLADMFVQILVKVLALDAVGD